MELYHLINSCPSLTLILVDLGNICQAIEVGDVNIRGSRNCIWTQAVLLTL